MPETRLSQGHIQVYTGDGEGQTTCALGLALRAVGQGFQVYMVQFMQGREAEAVRVVASRLAPDLTLRAFGRPGPDNLQAPAAEDLAPIQAAWDLARQVILAGKHDLVILGEINLALSGNLLSTAEVLQVLRDRPPWVEVVLTGRQAPPDLLEFADLVTEMRPVKQYYEVGVPARCGAEAQLPVTGRDTAAKLGRPAGSPRSCRANPLWQNAVSGKARPTG